MILKKNLIDLSINSKADLFNDCVDEALNKNRNRKYDIFFIDPPFLDKNLVQNLNFLKGIKCLKKNTY